jgi:transcription initiation factor TFIID subunit 13
LGRIEEMLDKKSEIDKTRKIMDPNDDKITKSAVKAFEEEPLNDLDDDVDMDMGNKAGAKSFGKSGR